MVYTYARLNTELLTGFANKANNRPGVLKDSENPWPFAGQTSIISASPQVRGKFRGKDGSAHTKYRSASD